jgi:hypothetical protein
MRHVVHSGIHETSTGHIGAGGIARQGNTGCAQQSKPIEHSGAAVAENAPNRSPNSSSTGCSLLRRSLEAVSAYLLTVRPACCHLVPRFGGGREHNARQASDAGRHGASLLQPRC